jgi:hypothetical protein
MDIEETREPAPPAGQRKPNHRPMTARGRMQRDTRISTQAADKPPLPSSTQTLDHQQQHQNADTQQQQRQQQTSAPLSRLDMVIGQSQNARQDAQEAHDRLRSSEIIGDEILIKLEETEAKLLGLCSVQKDTLSPM